MVCTVRIQMACEWYVYIIWERKGDNQTYIKHIHIYFNMIMKYTYVAASSRNFIMTTDGDAATYAEINDVSRQAFEMVDNKCYSNVQTTSSGGIERGGNVRSSTWKSWLVLVIAAAILLMLIFIVFVMSVIALSTTSSNVAALQELAGSVDHNSEEFFELRQNYSQLLKIVHRFEFQLAELSQLLDLNHEELSQNYSQLYLKYQQLESNVTKSLVYSEVQRLRSELECAFINTSCSDLPSYCPSGYYSMRDRSTAPVYCNMALTCGNITGGWMRVAELNMTDTSQQCPGDLVERNETGIRQCRIGENRCFSVYYSTADTLYLKVCGKITAYQVGSTNAFRQFYENRNTATIDSNYVAGVSLTHGTSPRQHIWTFAAALDRNDDVMELRNSHCPCRFDVDPFDPPPFVGEDYFCDAGYEEFMEGETGLQTDPLWDGTDCLCCNNSPWFYKQLPQPTTDDIEMRVCKDRSDENIAITEIEIYVQ